MQDKKNPTLTKVRKRGARVVQATTQKIFTKDPNINYRAFTPNLMTLLALCSGLVGLRYAYHGTFEPALTMIGIAMVLDGLDGRVARFIHGESKIGGQLDSLADFFNFGVCPALYLYLWSLKDGPKFVWLAVLIYTVCCCLRLAKFNVLADETPGPNLYFIGVASPAAALLVFLPMYIDQAEWISLSSHPIWIAIYMIIIGLLMILPFKTFSPKKISLSKNKLIWILLLAALTLGAFFLYPWAVLAIFSFFYLLSLPLQSRSLLKNKA